MIEELAYRVEQNEALMDIAADEYGEGMDTHFDE
jgi:hypothetical protein